MYTVWHRYGICKIIILHFLINLLAQDSGNSMNPFGNDYLVHHAVTPCGQHTVLWAK